MKILKNKHFGVGGLALLLAVSSCSQLEDAVVADTTADNPAVGLSAVNVAYQQMSALTNQANVYALMEHSSDEMLGPTRGTDWDDNGTWRRIHQHTWDAQHNQVQDAWDDLGTGVTRANAAIALSANNPAKLAESRFLRAFFLYYTVDLYGKAQLRQPTDSPEALPTVLDRGQVTDLIIADLRSALPDLPDGGNPNVATKDAAAFLLAKMYLNKAVYKQDPSNPAGPFTFAKSDMDSVVFYCNSIINAGKYTLANGLKEYFDAFSSTGQATSKEIILSLDNSTGNTARSVRNRYYMTLHYNQAPSGWNGFTTLADFYNSFESGDVRLGGDYPGLTNVTGVKAGFLVGQQFDQNKTALKDRAGNPLAFTPKVSLTQGTDGTSGGSVETGGIRVVKYLPIPTTSGSFDAIATDYVFYRYADVILMKAEAILRGATGDVTPISLVNSIRSNRGLTPLATLDLPRLLKERGNELYWEGWRRNDQIRFGTFLLPDNPASVLNGRTTSANFRVVYPIAQRAVDANPNLKQNVGY